MKCAVYTGTRNLYPMMVTAVKSLLHNSDVDKVYLFIEDDEFPYWLPDKVITRNVSDQTYFLPGSPNMKSQFSYMALIRSVFSKYFPECDRILSLDVDTIVVDDISDIWDLPIDDCYFSATHEPRLSKLTRGMYANVGTCLYNLEKIRQDKKDDDVLLLLNTFRYPYVEQDVYTLYCQGHIHEMPLEYNSTWNKEITGMAEHPKIIHFAGYKNWVDFEPYKMYERMPWGEV